MAEDKGPARGIRISDTMLKALAALIVITLIAAVFVVPKYGKVFKAYKVKLGMVLQQYKKHLPLD